MSKQPKKQLKPTINKIKKKENKKKPSLSKGKSLAKKNKNIKEIIKKTDSKKVVSRLKSVIPLTIKSTIPDNAFDSLLDYDKGKKKVGRPTLHDKDIYPKMYMLARMGYSIEAIALRIGVWPSQFQEWGKSIPEFKVAIKKCKDLALDWWTEQGSLNIHNKQFNAILWMMNMSNRHRWQTSNGNVNKNIKKELKYTEEQIQRTIQEVQIVNGNTAEVARILAEAGALESASTETIDAEADEVHSSHASS